jgi:thiol-disulfide isomerase/thioredoxin
VPAESPLRKIDAAGLAQAIESHRGKVVLVDFWATWCPPCLELLPHTAEWQRRLANSGFVVVAVSLDDPDNEAAVRRFLTQHMPNRAGASSEQWENLLSSYGVGPESVTAFGIDHGAIPHARLYGRDGQLLKTFSSGISPLALPEMEAAVLAALR